MKWARIINDVAVEVIDFNPSGRFHHDIEIMFNSVPDYVKAGAQLVNGEWVNLPDPPSPTPEMIAAQQAQEKALLREQQATSIRLERNGKLSSTDWTQVADAPVNKDAWAIYRQALRDIPLQPSFPENVIWPIEPQQ